MKVLLTPYAPKPDEPVLQEYPRPQLKRDSYLNLNGDWDFEISKNKTIQGYTKKIRVPFSPESVLSNVSETLGIDDYAFYRKTVELPKGFLKDRLILHFGAVDQTADIYINQNLVLTHVGGYVPFSIDITEYVVDSSFEISLRIQDLSDTSYHLTGKQRLTPGGIFYTAQSGIWQTVWLESVPKTYIEDLTLTPNYYDQSLSIKIHSRQLERVKVDVYFEEQFLFSQFFETRDFTLNMNPFYPWSPETPNLYRLHIQYGDDFVESYAGIRSFERKKTKNGTQQFYLNGKPYFQTGVLDQGYYSDGLLTPPSDQAMIDDILLMKQMGFNMLRKHIKMEPLRWYYHCDRLGMLVWQDMMSGTENKNVVFHHVLAILGIHLSDRFKGLFGRKNPIGRDLYEKDLDTMIRTLKNVPSICTWVPFNEAWGQFDTIRIHDKVKQLDPTRLIDHASGWSDHRNGDYHSRHIYFQPIRFKRRAARKRILALTEFGGYSLAIEGHRFNETSIFGYRVYKSESELETALDNLYSNVLTKQVRKGLSALVYTQLSDVEEEVNGFITYDRQKIKVDIDTMKAWNNHLIDLFNEQEKNS